MVVLVREVEQPADFAARGVHVEQDSLNARVAHRILEVRADALVRLHPRRRVEPTGLFHQRPGDAKNRNALRGHQIGLLAPGRIVHLVRIVAFVQRTLRHTRDDTQLPSRRPAVAPS
jgi:hypothetical protein